jgi:hypothetical protein
MTLVEKNFDRNQGEVFVNVIKISSFAVAALRITTGALSQDTAVSVPKATPTLPKTSTSGGVTLLGCAATAIQAAQTTSCEQAFQDGTVCVVTFITSVHPANTPTTVGTTQSCDFSKRK